MIALSIIWSHSQSNLIHFATSCNSVFDSFLLKFLMRKHFSIQHGLEASLEDFNTRFISRYESFRYNKRLIKITLVVRRELEYNVSTLLTSDVTGGLFTANCNFLYRIYVAPSALTKYIFFHVLLNVDKSSNVHLWWTYRPFASPKLHHHLPKRGEWSVHQMCVLCSRLFLCKVF